MSRLAAALARLVRRDEPTIAEQIYSVGPSPRDPRAAEHAIRTLLDRYMRDEASDHTAALVLAEWAHPSIGTLAAWSTFGLLVHAAEIGDTGYIERTVYRLAHGRRPAAADDDLLAVARAAGVTAPTDPSLTLEALQ